MGETEERREGKEGRGRKEGRDERRGSGGESRGNLALTVSRRLCSVLACPPLSFCASFSFLRNQLSAVSVNQIQHAE